MVIARVPVNDGRATSWSPATASHSRVAHRAEPHVGADSEAGAEAATTLVCVMISRWFLKFLGSCRWLGQEVGAATALDDVSGDLGQAAVCSSGGVA